MRVLIVAAVLACAAAAPSGLLAAPYGHGLVGHAAPLALAHGHGSVAVAHGAVAPTIPPGDLQGAAIDAHVEASDHARASHDAARELHDQASEIQGQQINAAEDHSWQAVDASLTHQAEIDGAAAGVAPVLAKQIAGHGAYAGYGGYGNAAGYGAAGYGAAGYGGAGYGAAGYGAAGYGAAGYGAAGYGAAGYGAAGYGAHSSTVVQQNLHQSHPAPVYHAAPIISHAAPAYGHGLSHGW